MPARTQPLRPAYDPESPYHGRRVVVELRDGRTVAARTRLRQDAAARLCQQFVDCESVPQAAEAVGLSRETAAVLLEKFGLYQRGASYRDRLTREVHAYTSPRTGKTIRTLAPPGLVRKAEDLYCDESWSARRIARHLQLNPDTVVGWLERLGVNRPAHYQQRAHFASQRGFDSVTALEAEIARLKGKGMTSVSRMLSGKACRLHGQAHRTTKKRGWKTGGAADRVAIMARARQALELREAGTPPLEIAGRLGVSVATVYTDFKRAARVAGPSEAA